MPPDLPSLPKGVGTVEDGGRINTGTKRSLVEGFEQQILNPLTIGETFCQGVFGIVFEKFSDAILRYSLRNQHP